MTAFVAKKAAHGKTLANRVADIICVVVEQIEDRTDLIMFALACKVFAKNVFMLYPVNHEKWDIFDLTYFESDYDLSRAQFLLSRPVADWMPLRLKFCRFCDKWKACTSKKREKGAYDDLVEPCQTCIWLKIEHADHIFPNECNGITTCNRYSNWVHGHEKERRWSENAWHPGAYVWENDQTLEDADSDGDILASIADDDLDEDDDNYDGRLRCAMCRAGLSCSREH